MPLLPGLVSEVCELADPLCCAGKTTVMFTMQTLGFPKKLLRVCSNCWAGLALGEHRDPPPKPKPAPVEESIEGWF